MISTPRISIGPAGCRINRDYARRGWATAETGHPNWGPRDPGVTVEHADRHFGLWHCMQLNSLPLTVPVLF